MDFEKLQLRANLYEKIRFYFKQTGVLEVTTPVLSFAGNTDPAIESFHTCSQQGMYLQTSPEFFMKRLLVAGSGSIYQLCPVFRQGESGRNHNPEFTMLEWYRQGYNYLELMDDVVALLQSVAGRRLDVKKISYLQAFQTISLDPFSASRDELERAARQHGISLQSSLVLSKDQWLDLLMSHVIEPSFEPASLTFVYDFPASQASLAQIRNDQQPVAERFELYWGRVELANGFTELQDGQEQRQRFLRDNRQRLQHGQKEVPVDEQFIRALDQGLPECSGVAIGVDRLLMIISGSASIDEVMAFPLSQV